MSALVTGATGFVGTRLCARLTAPHVLSRHPGDVRRKLGPEVKPFQWETSSIPPAESFTGVTEIFNLAGESVAEGRWTEKKKREIYDSRVKGTRALVDGIAKLAQKPRVLVSASAVGWYGDTGEVEIDESFPAASDFLAEVCQDWEKEARRAETLGVRVVCIRIGLVIGKGGALKKMLLPFKLGVGGKLGSGRQWMSWIHVEDLVSIFLLAAQQNSVSGVLNGTAPHPVRNEEFTKVLGSVLRRPTIFPVPSVALKLALGEFSSVLLASQKVLPKATLKAGMEFKFPELRAGLQDAIAP